MHVHLPHSFEYYDYLLGEPLQKDQELYRIEPSIDFINITVPFEVMNSNRMDLFIKDNFEVLSKRFYSNSVEEVYETNVPVLGMSDKMVAVQHYCRYGTTFQFKDINQEVISYMIKIFNGFYHRVSRVEYTLDFYTADNGEFFSFLASSATLKHRKGEFTPQADFETTRYLSNVRNTRTMGGRIYIKEDKEGSPVRIEAKLGNRKISANGLRTIEKAVTVSPSVPFERYMFKKFNHEKYLKNTYVKDVGLFENEFFETMNSSAKCGGFTQAMKIAREYKPSVGYYVEDHYFSGFFTALINEPMYETIYGAAV
ncbi:hypothetical protein [Maridesulfovibrio sp.]|uniref:hypothetical protein n=1 Tax=Maridesulfovibrio sp. TaxID=2795000 RepID=UPI002AA71335|nr:hypothetical protein [Maridesulfovibrio sp.]